MGRLVAMLVAVDLLLAVSARAALDVRGDWQVTFHCYALGSGAQHVAIDEDLGTGATSVSTDASCGGFTFPYGGGTIELGSCSTVPDPVVGQVTGTTVSTPATGYFTILSVPTVPGPGGCPTTITSTHRLTGTIVEQSGGIATRITGQMEIDDVALLLANATPCASASSYAYCSQEMRRNDVPVGSNVSVQPIAGVSLTFATVTGAGYALVKPLSAVASALPPGIEQVGSPHALSSTATASGLTTVCATYADANGDGFVDDEPGPVAASDLRLFSDDGSGFSDVTGSVDTVARRVCGTPGSLGTIVLGGPQTTLPSPCPPAVHDFEQPLGVTVSPDGAHAYSVEFDDRLVAFDRDPGTGALTPVQQIVNGAFGVTGMDLPEEVVVSPDGLHVYVSAIGSRSIAAFARDPGTGHLTFVGATSDGFGATDLPDGIAVSPDGQNLYAVPRFTDAMLVYARDPGTGLLSLVEAEPTGAAGNDGVASRVHPLVTPDGAHVYMVRSRTLVGFARDPGTGTLTLIPTATSGIPATLGDLRRAIVSTDGATVYASADTFNTANDAILVLARSVGTGTLTVVQVIQDPANNIGGGHLAISPDGVHVYASVNVGAAIFTRNVLDGTLTSLGTFVDVARDADWLAFGPDGLHLYAVRRFFEPQPIGAFTRDVSTGLLTAGPVVESMQARDLHLVRALAASPDGTYVYAAATGSDAVGVLCLDLDGRLVFVERKRNGEAGVDGLAGAADVVVSGDGANVYVAGRHDGTVATFDRDTGTGTLTFLARHRDGEAGVDGLAGARALALSPDGMHLYVAGMDEDAVAVFARNGGTGALTPSGVARNKTNGVDGLTGPYAVAVSPDGAHVYVTGFFDDSVVVFARNAGTGALTFVERVKNKVDGVVGMDGPRDVIVSHDGANVYVAAFHTASIVTFSRNAGSGRLTSLGTMSDPNFFSFRKLWSLEETPDGRFVYATGISPGGAFAVLARTPGTGVLAAPSFVGSSISGGPALALVGTDGAHVVLGDRTGLGGPGNGSFAVALRNVETGAVPDPYVLPSATFGQMPIPHPHCNAVQLAGKSQLRLVGGPDPELHAFKWKWSKGAAVPAPETPVDSSDLQIHVILSDASGAPQPLVERMLDDCFGCWKEGRPGVFKFSNSSSPSLNQMKIKTGSGAKARASLKGRGEFLELPALPLVPPVHIQVTTSTGETCLEATYSTPLTNDGTLFLANSD